MSEEVRRMDNEITKLCEGCKITDEEIQEVVVAEGNMLMSAERVRKCLVARIMSDKEVNKGAFCATMSKLWHAERQIFLRDIGWNRFLVEFQKKKDKNSVLQGRPWPFDKFLVCLQECDGNVALRDIQFSMEPFWIQFHNMPFVGMTRKIGEQLGVTIGRVLVMDTNESGTGWRKFLRVKILVDISKPLARGRFLNLGDKRFFYYY
ncbi:uncharacterized protein LOC121246281 [Juglans microcarpa x Juglans regia]|uniref:uncharacterized protein LOC121246281 n=1 Tax=Juglans microcarpa x Juglans regia TaxID=2249226 RepID=UPI001B7E210B|nr:uncharacterized protein LOC121246281 [Juglans microcarpa x Juglans regia]